jgi:glucosamine-6-phosphate deaminase
VLVILEDDDRSLSRNAAHIVAKTVRSQSHVTLGLATGSTPIGMYRELVRLHQEEQLDCYHIVTFNLDEYIGLSQTTRRAIMPTWPGISLIT